MVRAGLRALKAEAEAAKLAALNAAIQEGIEPGPPVPIHDIGAWLDEIDAEVEAQIVAEDAAARIPAE